MSQKVRKMSLVVKHRVHHNKTERLFCPNIVGARRGSQSQVRAGAHRGSQGRAGARRGTQGSAGERRGVQRARARRGAQGRAGAHRGAQGASQGRRAGARKGAQWLRGAQMQQHTHTSEHLLTCMAHMHGSPAAREVATHK